MGESEREGEMGVCVRDLESRVWERRERLRRERVGDGGWWDRERLFFT